ncbi:hypothetical protein CDAR_233171 [Caerostris darwini]|uniref:TIL domain-containing protein n=1 Tax=Caerostris darwini TaxID=1538125 RepID=A0AAV4Q3E1_9ARAC|nr:hypothetical protein CDAR_233171 [Caerostris darwini]
MKVFLLACLMALAVVSAKEQSTNHRCPKNAVWDQCGIDCPKTCEGQEIKCPLKCRVGCKCEEGYVQVHDKYDKRHRGRDIQCVKVKDCKLFKN